MSLLPLLKTGGEEEASLLPSHFGIGGGFSPPSRKWEGRRASVFAKSPELAAYSAADSPEKVRVQKQDRKVKSPGPQPISQKPVFSMF